MILILNLKCLIYALTNTKRENKVLKKCRLEHLGFEQWIFETKIGILIGIWARNRHFKNYCGYCVTAKFEIMR